jgi:hypothetical protein
MRLIVIYSNPSRNGASGYPKKWDLFPPLQTDKTFLKSGNAIGRHHHNRILGNGTFFSGGFP